MLSAALAVILQTAKAATLYWDGDGTGVVGGGAGTWDTTLSRWSTTAGGSTYQAWVNNAIADSAVFGGAAGAITPNGNITVNVITANVAAYTLGTSGSPATPVLTFSGDGAGIVANYSSGLTSLNYNYTGTVLNKSGTGRVDLNNSANTIGKYNLTGGFVTIAALNRLGTAPVALVADYFRMDGGGFGHSVAAGIDLGATRGITVGAGHAYFGASAAANVTIVSAPIVGSAGGNVIIASGLPMYSPYATGCNLQLNNTANNWNGNLTLSGASGSGVKLGAAGVIPDTCVVTISTSGNTFNLNGFDETVKSISGTAGTIAVGANTLTLDNPASESYSSVFTATSGGKVIKNGNGTLTLSGNSTGFAGEFIVNTGTIGYGGSGALGASATAGTITINGGKLSNTSTGGRSVVATVSVNLAGDFTVDDSLFGPNPGQILFNGPSTIKNGNRAITVNGAANLGLGGVIGQDVAGRSLTKLGSGLLALAGVNTYSGDTTISAGQINLNGTSTLGDATGTLHLSGGTLNSTATRTASSAPVANPIDITADSYVTTSSTAATVDLNLSSSTIGGSAGALTFSNSAASGSGVFQPRFSGSGFTLSRPIVIANGGFGTTALNSYNATGTDQTFSGVISGSGSYIRNASSAVTGGRTIFTQANNYSGGTTVNRGTLLVNNATGSGTGSGAVAVNPDGILGGTGTISGGVTVSGILAPGASIGTLTFGSSLALSGTTSMEINKAPGPVLTADKIVMSSGTVTLGGNLTVTATGNALALGDTFDLIDGAIAGSFASFTLPTPPAGLAWDTTKLAAGQNGTITLICDGSLTAGVVVDQNATCNGANNGKATVTFSGNGGPFQVQLDAGGFNAQTSPYQFTGLALGAHTVTVKDANGCTFTTGSFNITQPAVLTASAGADQGICAGTSSAIGGSPTPTGGTPGYTYLWNNAGTLSDATASNPIASPTNTTTYMVTVTDANGCSATASVTITVRPTASTGGNQNICLGSSTAGLGGTVGGTATGGYWASSGTGTFSPDTNTLNAVYNPSAQDITNGTVTLTLTTTGQEAPCNPVTAQMLVTITACEPDLQACWRGQGGSTFQSWTFATSNNPAALLPDLQTNAYGGASGNLSAGAFSDGYIASDAFLGSPQGIWDLGRSGTLTLAITNTSSGSAGSFKYVQVVVTQFRDSIYQQNATVNVPGGTFMAQVQQPVGTNDFGGQWIASRTVWRLGSPCPTSESVVITGGTNGSLLDQVVVETMCVDVTCLADVFGGTDPGQCSKSNMTWTVPALDGCLITNLVFTPPMGSTFPKGTNLVAMQVTDRYAGTQSCNFNVVIADDKSPTVVCPADITAARTPGFCGAIVSFAATPVDNCPGATAGCVPPSGSFFPLGLTTVTCTATDAVGNVSAPCTFTVRVDDYTGDVAAFQPCWRGQGGSTFQAWTFATSNNPAALPPNLATNVYGSVSGNLSFGTFSDGFIESDPFLGCRQGIWDLGHTGMLTLSITNTTAGSGGSYKYVQVVATQFRDSLYNENAAVAIPGGVQVGQAQQVVGTNNYGGEWIAVRTLWRLGSPCPASENIVITAGTNGTLMDQVVVETMCMDLTCPLDILTSADPGQCSKSNVSWSLPAIDGCIVTNIVCSPTNGATFPVGTNLVTCVITDGEGGVKTCNFNVTVLDDVAPIITSVAATELQTGLGAVNVKNCLSPTVQGTVDIVVVAGDACSAVGAPVVALTNGLANALATFVNQSPSGTFNYTWPVTAATSNGTWTVTVTATDAFSNVTSSNFTLCVNTAQITGLVQLEAFVGTGPLVQHSRVVTFVATAGITVLKTWSPALTNVSGDTFSYALTDVPAGTTGLSAKTAWNLREKLAVTLDVNGQAVANFVADGTPGWSDATDHYLRGGDITGNNIVNLGDYNLLLNNFLTPYAPADINGNGIANLAEYNLIQINWFMLGDPQ